jgi:hypothetical protein
MIETLRNHPSAEAQAWLLEMELIQTPTLLNATILNIFKSVNGLDDAQFVIDTHEKKILIYLELSWFAKKFFKKKVARNVQELLDSALPNFKKRIIFDKEILNKALAIVGR